MDLPYVDLDIFLSKESPDSAIISECKKVTAYQLFRCISNLLTDAISRLLMH